MMSKTPLLAVLLLAACTPAAPALDPAKVAFITVGHSSRSDVFGLLGQPTRTERNGLGESWVYEAKPGGNSGLITGASTASSMIGTVVPYAGLVGSGLGLGSSLGTPAATSSLVVSFRADGMVRDCAYSSTGLPMGLPGSTGPAAPINCQRP